MRMTVPGWQAGAVPVTSTSSPASGLAFEHHMLGLDFMTQHAVMYKGFCMSCLSVMMRSGAVRWPAMCENKAAASVIMM